MHIRSGDGPAYIRQPAAIEENGSAAKAAMLARNTHLSHSDAALVNGQRAILQDYDDTHMAGVILHASSPVLAALFSAAEMRAVSGRDFIAAYVAGFEAGTAASSGLLAAMLAEKGFGSSEEMVEGKRGFARIYSKQQALERLADGLGEQWLITTKGHMPYACGVVLHPAIDAMIALRADRRAGRHHRARRDQRESRCRRHHRRQSPCAKACGISRDSLTAGPSRR